MRKFRHYNLMFRPEPEGGYTVVVPSLPGCITYGETLEEAQEMAKDAISGYIASLKKHRQSIPSDEKAFIAAIDVAKV
jgi:predicted RNase H-like HicB family nuclease